MKTKKKRGRPPKKWPTWAEILVAAIKPYKGKKLPIERIFELVEKRPETKARAKSNRHIRDKIRQQLQFLRDDGRMDWIDRGVWRLR